MDPLLAIASMFTTSFLVGLSGAATPGPLLMVNIAHVARRGFWAAPQLVLGHSLLELAVVAVLALGLSPLLQAAPVAAAVALAGGVFLLWMAQDVVRNLGRLSLGAALGGPNPALVAGTAVVAGVTASASNPYWLVWWATAGAGLTAQSLLLGAAGLAAFYLGHISADVVWYCGVGALIASGRRLMNDTVYRGLLLACALFMGALGVLFLLTALAAARGAPITPG